MAYGDVIELREGPTGGLAVFNRNRQVNVPGAGPFVPYLATDARGNPIGISLPTGAAVIEPSVSLLPGSFVTDAATTSGLPTVSSATAGFTTADVGKLLTVTSTTVNTAIFTGTIVSVTNGVATLNVNSTVTIASGHCYWGNDNYAALSAALAAADTAATGSLFLGTGVFMLSSGVTIPDGVRVVGQGRSGSTFNEISRSGTRLVAGGNLTFPTAYLVKVGVTTLKTGKFGAQIEHCVVDGCNIVTSAVYLHGTASEVNFCAIRRGATNALLNDGFVCRITHNDIAQQLRGYCLNIGGGTDIMVYGNYIHGAAGTTGAPNACVFIGTVFTGDVKIIGNHIWTGEQALSSTTPCHCIQIKAVATTILLVNISNNMLDTPYGHQVAMDAGAGVLQSISVCNNLLLLNDVNYPNNTFDVVNLLNAGGIYSNINVSNNVGLNGLNANSYANLVNPNGTGTWQAMTISGNALTYCNLVVPAGYVVDNGINNNVIVNTSGVKTYTNNRGRSTQTGNGATVAFNIPHNMSDTPQTWSVVPRVALAAPNFIVTATSTNLVVTYATAPPATANNVDLTWTASL